MFMRAILFSANEFHFFPYRPIHGRISRIHRLDSTRRIADVLFFQFSHIERALAISSNSR